MNPFPASTLAHRILEDLAGRGRPSLGPESLSPSTLPESLHDSSDEELLGLDAIRSGDASRCVRSGLLLYAGDLDGSHDLSQTVHTREGSFWHGIMHRREPDYGNSKYWFRKVGDHAVFEALVGAMEPDSPLRDRLLDSGRWDPFAFVDEVESARRSGDSGRIHALEELQDLELRYLLAHCFRQAGGTPTLTA